VKFQGVLTAYIGKYVPLSCGSLFIFGRKYVVREKCENAKEKRRKRINKGNN
jgi:hypothetical protein